MKKVLINPQRCIGCKHCEIACAVEHSQSKNLFGAIAETPAPRTRINVEMGVAYLNFPNRCSHCEDAPCIYVCPVHALAKDEESGIVMLDSDKCVGCMMCAVVCPFGVPGWDVTNSSMLKCDGCVDRRSTGKEPACVEACKTGALRFGEVDDLMRDAKKEFSIKVTGALEAKEMAPTVPPNVQMWRDLSLPSGENV